MPRPNTEKSQNCRKTDVQEGGSKMTIAVFGKKNCGICDAAKDKLNKMGLDYEAHELADYTTHHDGWRDDDSAGLLASYLMMDKLPIIRINEKYHDYPGAMKRLKKELAGVQN